MDSTALNELIEQVRGTSAMLAEAEQRVAAFTAELALQKLPDASVLTHSFSTRRKVFFQRPPAACILLQDDIGFGCPLEGLRFGVALGEPDLDGSLEFGDAPLNLICRPVGIL